MMAFGSADDGSIFHNSAQDGLNLAIDGHYILKKKKDTKGSRACQQFRIVLISWLPTGSGTARLESCLILQILNEDSKCSELSVAVRVKYTLQKKVSCLQQVSLIQLGHIQVKSGSDLDYYPDHWVIRVSGTDLASTLMHTHESM